jgi:alpha-glucosidase
VAQARVAAMLLLTLRGTPTMYYGDELGMVDVPIPRERVQDPYEKNVPGLGVGRDPERTPMQWDGSRYAGFSTAEPWLPVSDDYPVVNVQAADVDHTSILTLYRRLLQLRRAHPALSIGDYVPVAMTGDLLAYIRRTKTERFLVALNLGEGPYAVSLTSLNTTGRTVLSTHLDRDESTPTDTISLRANEGVLIALPAEGEHRIA